MPITTFLVCSVAVFLLGYGLGAFRYSGCATFIYTIMRRFEHDDAEAYLMAALDEASPLCWPKKIDELIYQSKKRS